MVGWRSTTLPTKLYSNTNIPRNNQCAIHEGQQELEVSSQQLNKHLTSFVLSFTEITPFGPSIRLSH